MVVHNGLDRAALVSGNDNLCPAGPPRNPASLDSLSIIDTCFTYDDTLHPLQCADHGGGPVRFSAAATLLLLISTLLPSIARGQDGPARFEVGPVLSFDREYNRAEPNRFLIGGRVAWNIGRHLGLEGEASTSPNNFASGSGYVGGRLMGGLFGAKYGARWGKLGIFGKARTGFVQWSAVANGLVATASGGFMLVTARQTSPVLDLGGAFEYYVSRRWMIRIDPGINLIWHGAYSVRDVEPSGSVNVVRLPRTLNGAFAYSTSFQYRFGGDTYKPTAKPEGENDQHTFWDLQNDLLFVGVAATRAADYSSSISAQHRGHLGDGFLGDVALNHPALATIEVAGTASSILAAYLFHRSNHHKLERATSYVHIGLSTSGVLGNFAASNEHMTKTPGIRSQRP